MSYDKMEWHYAGDYPADLPPENGGIHIGMFLCWCILNGLSGEIHEEDSAEALDAVRQRKMTGRKFLQSMCDERFWEEDLNDLGNQFAKIYYDSDEYIYDYDSILAVNLESIYRVEDTWANYDLLAPRIDERFRRFCETGAVK